MLCCGYSLTEPLHRQPPPYQLQQVKTRMVLQRLAETQCGCTEAAIQVSQRINGKVVACVFNRKHIDCTGTEHTHKAMLPGVQCTLLYNPHFAIQI